MAGKRARVPDACRLLHRPYTPQPLRRGDRATCLFRDGDVVITAWSDAGIPWPRCRRADSGGGSGLLVDAELLRALRTESSLAVQFWWGVNGETVWRWRQVIGIGQWEPEGSRRLHRALSEAGARTTRGKRLPADQVGRRRRTARELGLKPTGCWAEAGWTRERLALLGTLPDERLAARIGRTVTAVRVMRTRLGIPSARDRRRTGRGPAGAQRGGSAGG
jgi:hypothetical protein